MARTCAEFHAAFGSSIPSTKLQATQFASLLIEKLAVSWSF
jgi:hypothetical protein